MLIKDGVEIRLQEVLDSLGMKQEFLCRKTKISTTSMSALCRGESLPKLKTSLKIAKALDKNVEDLWILKENID
jgi:DNA-binding XRE family transcriptional regulator